MTGSPRRTSRGSSALPGRRYRRCSRADGMAAMPLLKVNDIELYYESHGSGDPLARIGGLGLTVAEMRPLIGALAAGGYRVIAADNRGAGQSAKPPGPYTIGQMAGDVAGLLTRIG